MPLNKLQKREYFDKANADLAEAQSVLILDCSGVDSNTMNKVRREARANGVKVFVAYNVITKKAIADTAWSYMADYLKGPTTLAISYDAPSTAARLFKDFVKSHGNIEVKSICLDGNILPGAELAKIAKLPNRHEALCQLASALSSPATMLAMALNDSVTRLARVLNAVAENKG